MNAEFDDYVFDEPEDERLRRELERNPDRAREAQQLRALAQQLRSMPAEAWELVQTPPQPQPRQRRTLTWRRAALCLAAAAVLFAGGIGAGIAIEHRAAPGGTEVALRPLSVQTAHAKATARLQNGDHLELSFNGMPAAGSGAYYEAWLMTSTTRLIPLASFRPGAHGRARLQTIVPAPVRAYRYIDISLQRLGAGTRHSRDSVLRGPTAPLR